MFAWRHRIPQPSAFLSIVERGWLSGVQFMPRLAMQQAALLDCLACDGLPSFADDFGLAETDVCGVMLSGLR